MKVCHFIASPGIGRGEVYIDLVNSLSLEVDIILLVPKYNTYNERLSKNIILIEYSSNNSRYNPFLYIELFNIFKNNKFDIVHTHFAKSTYIFYYLNKIFNIPQVSTKHNPRKGKIFEKINNVIAVSKDVKRSIYNSNVQIIYNGIKDIKLNPFLHNNSVFTMIAIGRLEKVKGFDYLIKECSKLNFDFNLKIIGEGQERKELELLILSLNLEDKIQLLGYRMDIPELLQKSDLQIISSLSEGFSMAFLEGLHYCKVVISTNVGIMKEILDEDFVVKKDNISNKIITIHNEYSMYENKFKLFQDKYKDIFTLSNTTKEHILCYKKILTSKKKVAVIRFSALGDIMSATPTIRSLKYKPTIITSPIGKSLLEDEFDNFIVLENKNILSLIKLILEIRKQNFDIVLDFQCNDRSHFISKFIDANIYNNDNISSDNYNRNIFNLIATQSRILGNIDYTFKAKERNYIVLNTGSSPGWESKRLPFSKWKEISQLLTNRYNLPFILTGSPDEIEYVKEIEKSIVGECENKAGKTSIQELKSVLNNAFLTISTDSGPMHMSAIMATPTIGIFGPTNWIKSSPFGPWSTIVYDKIYFKDLKPLKQNSRELNNYFDNIDISEALESLSEYLK